MRKRKGNLLSIRPKQVDPKGKSETNSFYQNENERSKRKEPQNGKTVLSLSKKRSPTPEKVIPRFKEIHFEERLLQSPAIVREHRTWYNDIWKRFQLVETK